MRSLRAGRIVASLPVFFLGWLSVADYLDFREVRDAMVALVVELGVAARRPDARTLVEREPDVDHLRLVAARSILSDAFDAAAHAEASPEARLAQLRAAREQAEQAAERLPVAYQAPMIRGGATMLSLELSGDAALYAEPASWEAPLRRSIALAPGHREPQRLLAVGKLLTWFALAEPERDEARGLLSELFVADPDEFDRLVGAWIETASSLDEALAIVPSRPRAWMRLQKIFAQRGEWESAALARRRFWELLPSDCEATLATADALLTEGTMRLARQAYLDVMVAAVPDVRHVGLLGRAVAQCPPGPVNDDVESALRSWVAWAIRISMSGAQPIPAEIFGRVSRLASLEPPLAAAAALQNGDLPEAERIERNAEGVDGPGWSPYLFGKARQLLARGDAAGARRALGEVELGLRRTPTWVALAAEIAAAAQDAGDTLAAPRPGGPAAMDEIRASRWPAAAWHLEGTEAWIELLPSAAAPGLSIALVPISEQGAVADLTWDGALVRSVGIATSGSVELPIAVTPEPHLLVVRTVEGARVVPGEVELSAAR